MQLLDVVHFNTIHMVMWSHMTSHVLPNAESVGTTSPYTFEYVLHSHSEGI
jgi:hypothetical protein